MRKYSRFNLYLDGEDKTMLYWLASQEQAATGRRVSPSMLVKRWLRTEYAQRGGPALDTTPDADADTPGELAA